MGARIKANENETRRESQLLTSVLVHVASACICALACCYSFWFPWLSCVIKHFVWIYLPNVWPVVFGPKYMFFVANAIVLVVFSDWRQTCSKSKTIRLDIYDEYVQRCRRPRRVLIYKKIYAKANEIKTVEEIVEKKEDIIAEEDIIMPEDTNSEETVEMIDEASESESEKKREEVILGFDDRCSDSAEEISASNDHDDESIIEKGRERGQGEMEDMKKAEQRGSNDGELNKRVEDFIARVNRRRWAEANNLLICSA